MASIVVLLLTYHYSDPSWLHRMFGGTPLPATRISDQGVFTACGDDGSDNSANEGHTRGGRISKN